MKKKSVILNVIIFTILIGTIYSQNDNSNVSSQITPRNQAKSETDKISVMETKLEVMNDYNNRILDNIYWALSAIATVIFIVLGLSIYNAKRNIDELKREIKISLHQELLSKLNETVSEEIQRIKSSELSDINKMKYDFAKMQVENWKSKKVSANVLTSSLKLLKIAQETGSKYDIIETLDYVKDAIKAGGLKNRNTIAYVDLLEALDKLDDKFPTETDAIRNLIKSQDAE